MYAEKNVNHKFQWYKWLFNISFIQNKNIQIGVWTITRTWNRRKSIRLSDILKPAYVHMYTDTVLPKSNYVFIVELMFPIEYSIRWTNQNKTLLDQG